jgi:hypothetical protein
VRAILTDLPQTGASKSQPSAACIFNKRRIDFYQHKVQFDFSKEI